MKFVSKSANLHVILRPGLPAQPITGTPATATISVRFQDGVANIDQKELVEMMLQHPGFNQDFIAADDNGTDPYLYLREPSEPDHVLTEMKFGHPVSRNVSPVKRPLPPEVMKVVQEQAEKMATKMAKDMLPGMVKEVLKDLQAQAAAKKEPTLSAPAADQVDQSPEESSSVVAPIATVIDQPAASVVAPIATVIDQPAAGQAKPKSATPRATGQKKSAK